MTIAFILMLVGGALVGLGFSMKNDFSVAGFIIGIIGYLLALTSSGYYQHMDTINEMKEKTHTIKVKDNNHFKTDTMYVDSTGRPKVFHYYKGARIVD